MRMERSSRFSFFSFFFFLFFFSIPACLLACSDCEEDQGEKGEPGGEPRCCKEEGSCWRLLALLCLNGTDVLQNIFSVLLQTAPEEVWRCGKPPTRPKPLHHQHWRGYSPQAQPQDLGSQFSILICPAAHFDLVLFLFSRGQLVEVEEEKPDAFGALGKAKSKLVVCRICKGDHWTLKCPYKDTIGALAEITSEEPKEEQPAKSQQSNKSAGAGKYVPPSLRGGAGAEKKGESMNRDKGLFSFFFLSFFFIS